MISNLKKALRREKEPPSAQPIYGISNRGNKLKKGANHVHLGSLANTNGPEPYKQKIEHAGYIRYILERKPTRYNDYGDEVSNYDSEDELDIRAAEADPYEGIRLEELLRPLTHPSELATHSTLSLPYLDPALPEMVKTAEENLRQERANLWRAKALNRQLLGDEAWMPLSVVESPDDWDLFEPRPAHAAGPANKRRKLNGSSHQADGDNASVSQIGGSTDGVDRETSINGPSNSDMMGEETTQNTRDTTMPEATSAEQPAAEEPQQDQNLLNGDTAMKDRKPELEINGIDNSEDTLPTDGQPKEGSSAEGRPQDTEEAVAEDNHQDAEDHHGSGESSPAPPPRRITRALAAGNNSNSGAPTPPFSPSPTLTASDSSLLQVDPMFLLQPAIHATNRVSALYGLPADEAIETRKLLTAYIQKQEECVRGLESLAAKLISALKLRKEVWDMCKAEGHVGELSDGEDWIDAEAWGLKEGELRKGRFEEEDIQEEREAIGGGRKGKRRRREQN